MEKTEEPTSPLFEEWLEKRQRELKPELVNPPAGAVDVEGARARFRAESADWWNARLKEGWYPSELASGELSPGSERNAVTGRPVRLPDTRASASEESQARQVLEELRSRGLADNFDPPLMVHLREAARGVFTSAPVSLRAAIKEARTACTAYDGAQAAKASEQAGLGVIRVTRACGPGRKWMGSVRQPMEHRLTSGQLLELQVWREHQEADARRHGWEYPEGYADCWPPYEVLQAAGPAPVREPAIGGSLFTP